MEVFDTLSVKDLMETIRKADIKIIPEKAAPEKAAPEKPAAPLEPTAAATDAAVAAAVRKVAELVVVVQRCVLNRAT